MINAVAPLVVVAVFHFKNTETSKNKIIKVLLLLEQVNIDIEY
jgi:hypothetical protein